jgi:hypothetical protein
LTTRTDQKRRLPVDRAEAGTSSGEVVISIATAVAARLSSSRPVA